MSDRDFEMYEDFMLGAISGEEYEKYLEENK